MGTQPVPEGLEVHPVAPDRWDDLVDVAGERGFMSGCWYMWAGYARPRPSTHGSCRLRCGAYYRRRR